MDMTIDIPSDCLYDPSERNKIGYEFFNTSDSIVNDYTMDYTNENTQDISVYDNDFMSQYDYSQCLPEGSEYQLKLKSYIRYDKLTREKFAYERNLFTKEQKKILNEYYSSKKYVSKEDITDLCGRTGLTQKQIRTYFVNRRIRFRDESPEEE